MLVPQYGGYDYVPLIQDYVRWKEQRGDRVTVVPTSAISWPPNAARVRQLVTDSLRATPPVDFVVLVGDENRLPVRTQYTADPPTRFGTETMQGLYTDDNYFAAVEGSDVYPDVFLGRWVVDLPEEVLTYVRRTVDHELFTCISDSARFRRALMASDMEEPSQRQTKRDVRTRLMRNGFAVVDTVWGLSVSPWALTNRVNTGEAFVNYRGTGWSYGWVGVNFYVDNIPDISNRYKLPIVTGIGCGAGMFGPGIGEGFGEAWMTAGSVSEPKGAAGFIGPCWNTHTVYNDCLDSLLYRAWLDYDVRHLMSGLVAGKMMVCGMMAQFLNEPAVVEVVKTMFRQYLVQGDPALQVFTRIPFPLDVSLPSELPTGPGTISVTVNNALDSPADSLNVTLWRGPGDFETRWIAPGQSVAEFAFEPSQADTVVVTVTGDNVRAFQRRIPDSGSAVPPSVAAGLPERLELMQNYPNPFNSQTVIAFTLPAATQVRMEVFDILGRRVATLADRTFAAGRHSLTWDGAYLAGSGLYFCRLTTPEVVQARKMILLR
jgi:hypothetical protein